MTRVLFLVLLAIAQASEPAPDPPQVSPEPLTIKGADLQLLGTVREISRQVQEIRGQKFDRPPVATDWMLAVAPGPTWASALPRLPKRCTSRSPAIWTGSASIRKAIACWWRPTV